MIIDSHVHLCEPPHNQDKLSLKMADGRVLNLDVTRADASVDRLLRDMDECQVDQALVMAIIDWVSNESLSELVRAHPTRLVGFAWVTNPRDGDESVRQLDKAVNELGLRGLKLHPDAQGFSTADPEIVPLIRRAAELDIPILIHSHPGIMGVPGHFHSDLPEHFDTLKKRVPEATLIVGHMGGVRFLDLLTIAGQQGVYVETSWTLTMIADLFGIDFATRFIRRLGVDNVLYGSDWFGPHKEMSNQLSLIEKMDLTPEERGKILGGNIRRVLEARS